MVCLKCRHVFNLPIGMRRNILLIVMSALGFYEVCPGTPEYWLGSPRFDEAIVTLPNGRKLRILAKGAGEGRVFVRGVTLNGRRLRDYKLSHQQITAGGTLRFEMEDNPN